MRPESSDATYNAMHTRNTKRLGFWQGVFNSVVDRAIAANDLPAYFARATVEEIAEYCGRAREKMLIAGDAAITKVRAHNVQVFQTLRDAATDQVIGMTAVLPLTQAGVEAITSGGFDAANPDVAHITRSIERPRAFYFWLIYTPGTFWRALEPMAAMFREMSPDACPIFSRAVNEQSARLQALIGFRQAKERYPSAPDWLLVAAPDRKPGGGGGWVGAASI